MKLTCYVCHEEAAAFHECGPGALICDPCAKAGKCCGESHAGDPPYDALIPKNQVSARVLFFPPSHA
jgi:hypothetical protein